MRSKGWSMVLGGVAVALLAAIIPLSVFAHLVGDGVVALVIGVPCTAIGFLIARRQPRNPRSCSMFMHHFRFSSVSHMAGWLCLVC